VRTAAVHGISARAHGPGSGGGRSFDGTTLERDAAHDEWLAHHGPQPDVTTHTHPANLSPDSSTARLKARTVHASPQAAAHERKRATFQSLMINVAASRRKLSLL